jgi:tetratricopeptide (TPR) repeat protein
MRQTGTNAKEYLELYRISWSDLQSQSRPTRHYQQGNMVQTWMVTYQEIQKRDPTAAKLLLLLAFFDNQDIWYELLRSGLNCSGLPPWFKMAVSSKLVFKTKVKALVGFSLVETKQQGGSYALHPVVQDWCHHVADYDNLTCQLHELALMSVGYMVPHDSEREYAEIQQRLLPHANYLISRESGRWQSDTIDMWNALNSIGNLYTHQGKLKEAEEIYQRALEGKKKALGPDHSSTLATVNNLGLLYSHQGKPKEAEEMYQRALAGKEKALGPDHLSTLNTVNNLGLLYSHQGKPKEAEEIYQRALTGKEKALGPDHSKTHTAANNPLSLTTLRANQDTPRHTGTVTPAAPDLLLNTLGSTKRRRK